MLKKDGKWLDQEKKKKKKIMKEKKATSIEREQNETHKRIHEFRIKTLK